MKKRFMHKLVLVVLLLSTLTPSFAGTMEDILIGATQMYRAATEKAPVTAEMEIGFSPEGSGEALVLKVINTSRESVRLAAYSFTSPKIVRALIAAKRRGVDVQIVVDEDSNLGKGRNGSISKGREALNLVANAGIPVRTVGRYAILHDKTIVSDGRHVQTGSFNYSQAAAKSNSENVLVVWNNPQLAASYLRHWNSRFAQGAPYRSRY